MNFIDSVWEAISHTYHNSFIYRKFLRRFVLINKLGSYVANKRDNNYKKAIKNENFPTEQMIKSREYYTKNIDRVNKILSTLYDEDSKECYKKMITFRCYSNTDDFPQCYQSDTYFDNNYFNYGNNEVFVDCGAYIGDTIRAFKRIMQKYKGENSYRIIAFEPNFKNYKELEKNKNVVIIKAAVGDRNEHLHFDISKGNSSAITLSEEKSYEFYYLVPVKRIDDCSECKSCTLLKMDVEGFELKALIGAKETIKNNLPKLVISIYHSDEDMLDIPEWIHENFPEYRLYIKQHDKYAIWDTILYAVADEY
ncbi:MAG: FkbM family methyltransferase [Oscillospiraceae bacterium]|jgi:FkbM family methyltransferase|nr:FkbM family methyltransferase [Oscillospiraceae bacterium]